LVNAKDAPSANTKDAPSANANHSDVAWTSFRGGLISWWSDLDAVGCHVRSRLEQHPPLFDCAWDENVLWKPKAVLSGSAAIIHFQLGLLLVASFVVRCRDLGSHRTLSRRHRSIQRGIPPPGRYPSCGRSFVSWDAFPPGQL